MYVCLRISYCTYACHVYVFILENIFHAEMSRNTAKEQQAFCIVVVPADIPRDTKLDILIVSTSYENLEQVRKVFS